MRRQVTLFATSALLAVPLALFGAQAADTAVQAVAPPELAAAIPDAEAEAAALGGLACHGKRTEASRLPVRRTNGTVAYLLPGACSWSASQVYVQPGCDVIVYAGVFYMGTLKSTGWYGHRAGTHREYRQVC